jgi:hypothetical protein
MVMNLQYFGWRGGSSGLGGGGTVAFDVNMKGSRVSYVVRNGKVYSETGDQIALSANQIMKNAKNLGYDVKTYNAKQATVREQQRAEDRKKTNEFINISDAQMGGRRGDQRRTTRGRRGGRKGI